MRTKIKVVGIGQRMSGTSKKNGKPYDFLPVSFVYPDQYMNGLKAATANISGDMVDAIGGLKLEDQKEIFFHSFNGSVIVDGIL
ncbi:MAG: hypothetical protein SO002_06560 [Candidatus Faecousia sp.]|nr:hypothetical protein [Candidatus Faecousia sp.]